LLVAVVLIVAAISSHLKNNSSNQNTMAITQVALISLADWREEKMIDLGNATVESAGQVDLKAQISAPIAEVRVKLGDTVNAGQLLVQLQNNDIKAQLEQAQAGLTVAQAKLDELQRGSRAEEIAISQTAVDESRKALINSIKDAYAKSDDAIHNHIDKFFTNPRESSAKFQLEINISGAPKTIFYANDIELANKVERKNII